MMPEIQTIDMRHPDVPRLYAKVADTPFAADRILNDLHQRMASAILYALLDSQAWSHRHAYDPPTFPVDSYRFRWFETEWPDPAPIIESFRSLCGPLLLEPPQPVVHADGQKDLGYLLIPIKTQTTAPTIYVAPVRYIRYQNEDDQEWRNALVLDGFLPLPWSDDLPSFAAVEAIVNSIDPPFELPFYEHVSHDGRRTFADIEKALKIITAAALDTVEKPRTADGCLIVEPHLPRALRTEDSPDPPWFSYNGQPYKFSEARSFRAWETTIRMVLWRTRLVAVRYHLSDLNPHRRSGFIMTTHQLELEIPSQASAEDLSWVRGYLADLGIKAHSFLKPASSTRPG